MSDSYEIKCKFGNKALPVVVTPIGDQLWVNFSFFRPMIEEVKSMEGKKWHPELKTWAVANTSRNIFAFDILMNGSKIAVYDKDIEDWYRKDMLMYLSFWKHQQSMYNDIMTRKRVLLAAEMRTGKTRPTLKAIENADCQYAWWVAPTSALRGLPSEIEKWGFEGKLYTMTYDKFTTNAVAILEGGDVLAPPFPKFIVFDEIQKLKNPTSNRSKAARGLVDAMQDKWAGKEYVVGLSGTPSPKDPSDWWNLCEVTRPGFIRESNKHMFERRLGEWEQREGAVGNKYWHLVEWKEEEVELLSKRLKGLVCVYLKKDCLDLPDKMYEVVYLPPSKKILRVAKTIADNAPNVITAINKLRQLSDGFQYEKGYDEVKNREVRIGTNFIGSPKVDRLREDLENHEGVGRIIVYAGYQGSIDVICETCCDEDWTVLQVDGRGWKVYISSTDYARIDERLLDLDWVQNTDNLLHEMDRSADTGTVRKLAFVAQTDSAGTGLELSASPTVIYYSNSNNGDGRMQSEDRPHSNNMDKVRGLTIIDYIHLPTDEKIRDSLLRKKNLQSMSMGDLKSSFLGVEL